MEVPGRRRRLFIEAEMGTQSIATANPARSGAIISKLARYATFFSALARDGDRESSVSWVYHKAEDGTLPVRRLGGWGIRFVPRELRAWVEGAAEVNRLRFGLTPLAPSLAAATTSANSNGENSQALAALGQRLGTSLVQSAREPKREGREPGRTVGSPGL